MANESILGATLYIDDKAASIVLDKFPGKVKKASDEINKIGDNPLAGKLMTDFDALSKRVEETRLQFQEVAKVRLDNGQIGAFTKEILTAQKHSRQLAADIVNIRKELANPNRTSSITFLTATLRAAEAEADRLNLKLNSLPVGAAQGGIGRGAANNLKLSGFQKTNLSYQINDVATSLASGINPSQVLAQQGGQIAQIFSAEQIVGFTAAYGGLVSILGAGTLAIAATYKITGDIRKEAERLLAVETSITAARNRQILGQREALANLQKISDQAVNDRQLSKFFETATTQELDRKIKYFEQLSKIIPATLAVIENGKFVSKVNPDFELNSQQLLSARAQFAARSDQDFKKLSDASNQSYESYRKSQESNLEFEKKRNEEAAKLREKLKEKTSAIREDFREFMISARSADNPFVKLFDDMDTAGARAQKRFGELARVVGNDLAGQFVKLASSAEMAQLSTKLFEAKLDNKLEAFNLREKANDFRKPIGESREAMAQRIEGIVKEYLGADQRLGIGGQNAGNALINNRPKNLTDAQLNQDLFEYATLFNASAQKGSQQDAIRYLASVRRQMRGEDMNLSIQERLEKQFGIVNSFSPANEQERAIADKKITALAQSGRPEQFTERQREQIAAAYERQAVQKDAEQTDAIKDRKELKTAIEAITRALTEKGIKVDMPPPQVNVTLNGVDAGVEQDHSFLPDAPNRSHVKTHYEQYENSFYR